MSFPWNHGAESHETQPPDQAPDRPPEILLVDDDRMLRQLGVTILKHIGCHASIAEDGRQALDQINDHPDQFDLVITDINMPEMNGKELIKELHLHWPHLPIIVCSGDPEESVFDEGERPYGTLFISKPYTIAEMTETIHAALDMSFAHAGHGRD